MPLLKTTRASIAGLSVASRYGLKSSGALLILITCLIVCTPLADAVQSHDIESKQHAADDDVLPAATPKQNSVVVIPCQAVIERRSSFGREFVTAEVDVSSLEAGVKYRLDITVANPYESSIIFSAASLSCGCGKFASESREIPGFGSSEFELHLTIPNIVSNGRSSQTVTFSGSDPSQTVLNLNINYSVANAFRFMKDRVLIEVPKVDRAFRAVVPVESVGPINLEDFDLVVPEALRDINVKFLAADEHSRFPYVVLEAASNVIPKEGIRDNVVLKSRINGLDSKVHVTIVQQESFQLRPESLRFYRRSNSAPFQANAVLRVNRDKEVSREFRGEDGDLKNEKDKQASIPPPQIELIIGNEPARVLVNQLGASGIYKLTIYFDEDMPDLKGGESDDSCNLQWLIRMNGEERTISSQAFFSNR